MDIREIQNLIKFVAKSGATEVKLEMDDFKITIKTTAEGTESTTTYVQQMPMQAAPQMAAPQIAAAPVVADAPAATPAADDNAKYITVKSPIIGTFYRKPAPDKPMFVESEVSGKIVKVLVDDSSPVEFDQPLFLVDPS